MSIMVTTLMYPESEQKNEWVELIRQNRETFCRLSDGFGIARDPKVGGNPCLERIEIIIECLQEYGKVLWLGADCVCLHEIHEVDLPNELAMAHDIGGLNDDVLVTVAADLPMWKIMRQVFPLYEKNPMLSQAIMNDMKTAHKILPLDQWNARWTKEYTKVIHYPGLSIEGQFTNVKRACLGAQVRLLDGVKL